MTCTLRLLRGFSRNEWANKTWSMTTRYPFWPLPPRLNFPSYSTPDSPPLAMIGSIFCRLKRSLHFSIPSKDFTLFINSIAPKRPVRSIWSYSLLYHLPRWKLVSFHENGETDSVRLHRVVNTGLWCFLTSGVHYAAWVTALYTTESFSSTSSSTGKIFPNTH